jgi:uncharacterized protein
MDAQLSLLIQLQEVDAQIRVLDDQKKRLPELLADLDRKRAENKAEIEKTKENLQEAQKNKRDRDQDLEAEIGKVEKLKARSSEIKNNKEYQALLKEIAAAEQSNKLIEDEILVLMEKIDAASAAISEAEQRDAREEAVLQNERKVHEEEFSRISRDLKAAQKAREELMEHVEPEVGEHYEKLLASKGAGSVLAEVRSESCSGCYMSIPPQLFVNVKKNAKILTCPNCYRILFFKEAITPQTA